MAKESQEYEKFAPSKELAEIIYDNTIEPTGEDLRMIKYMLRSRGEEWPPDEELKQSLISVLAESIEEGIYGLLTSFAKHCLYCSFLIDGRALITKDGKFISWAFLDIIDRFELNTEKDLSPVFNRLFSELAAFYAIPRQYVVWGSVAIENGELKIFVNDDAFKLPDFDKPDSKKWHVTE
ncbi:MAG: hypothetical protein AAB949_01420 [Patescibacteria group bacterium]